MGDWYVLDEKNNVVKAGMITAARWMQENRNKRIVKQETINGERLSTVFLGLDHSYGGPPLLFETMVFDGPNDGQQWRYQTWNEAVTAHDQIAEKLRDGQSVKDFEPEFSSKESV